MNNQSKITVNSWVAFQYIGQEKLIGDKQFQVSAISPCGRIATIGRNMKCRVDQLVPVPAPIDFGSSTTETIECNMNECLGFLSFV